MATRVPPEEFRARLAEIRGRIADTEADAAAWFGATSIEYLTGFHHIQTERPVCLAVSQDRVEITVPRLEVERVETNPRIDAVHHYFDYPGGNRSKQWWTCSVDSMPNTSSPMAMALQG